LSTDEIDLYQTRLESMAAKSSRCLIVRAHGNADEVRRVAQNSILERLRSKS
jgi:hypothetical protein